MTRKEWHLFILMIAISSALLTAIGIGLWQSVVHVALDPVAKPLKAVLEAEDKAPKSQQVRDVALKAYRDRTSALELQVVHRGIESEVLEVVNGQKQIGREAFEVLMTPILLAYFDYWRASVAEHILAEHQMAYDRALYDEMLAMPIDIEMLRFMIIYEKTFLEHRGIRVVD